MVKMCGIVEILTISGITGDFAVQVFFHFFLGGNVEELMHYHGVHLILGCAK